MGVDVTYATKLVRPDGTVEYGTISSMHRYLTENMRVKPYRWPGIRSEIEHLIATAPDPDVELYYGSDSDLDDGTDIVDTAPRIDDAWIEKMQATYDAWLAAGSEEALKWGQERPYEPKPTGCPWDDYGTWEKWRADRA